MICRAIKSTDIDSVWDEVGPLLERALGYAFEGTTKDDIYTALVLGNCLLLVVEDAKKIISALSLKLTNGKHKRLCLIQYAGGEKLDIWQDGVLDVIKTIAREAGAQALYICGRRGWLKRLKKDGFEELYTTIGMEL